MSLNRSISIEFKFIVDLFKYQHNVDIIKKALASDLPVVLLFIAWYPTIMSVENKPHFMMRQLLEQITSDQLLTKPGTSITWSVDL